MISPAKPAALTISANFFKKLIVQRHLIWNLVVRDLRSRYIGSFMGFFWSVVHPLVLLIAYTFVFSIVFQIRPYTAATDNFAVFLFCGILPWLYFQDTVSRSCTCIVDSSNLIRKTLFPSEILPVSLALSNLVTHLIGLGILMVVLGWMGLLHWTILLIPIYLLLLTLFALGLGWLLASLQVFVRDTYQILTVAMVFWFWFTPIFYTVERVPGYLGTLVGFNPLSPIVESYRLALLDHQLPETGAIVAMTAWAVGTFILGGFLFRNTKREFADVL